MKTSFALILSVPVLLSAAISRAQVRDLQALSKYSYPIFAFTDGQQHTGTAFFYKSGDTAFLVSNYHAIKGMSPLKKTIAFTADTLYLKYRVKDSHDFRIMPINISEDVIGATEIFSMVDRIDLLKIAVQPPADGDIYFINDLIDPAYADAVPDEVVAFGFPTGPGSIPAFYAHQQRLEGQINPLGFTEYDDSLKNAFPAASDSARAVINATSRYYYFIKPYAAQGYSGSPVFGKFRTAGNRTIYRFTGVIFAAQPMTKQTWAIKGDVALQYLQGEL